MKQIRRSEERGVAEHGWLSSRHTFSFGQYFDARYQGVSKLLVINEDKIDPDQGFPTHPHRDMEIISYVLEGELAHKDSLGNGAVIRPGEIQKMSAGSGITHSEYNHAQDQQTHFLQIWIEPNQTGIEPGYQQERIPAEAMHNQWCLLVAPAGEAGLISLTQDARLYASKLEAGQNLHFDIDPERDYWLQMVRGSLNWQGEEFNAGDGVHFRDEALDLTALENAECLLFDLPR